MEVEAKRSLPPPPNPTENIRRAGLLRGRVMADDIRREIDIVRKFVGPLGSALIMKYDMDVIVPSNSDPQNWGEVLERYLNPLFPIDQRPVDQTNGSSVQDLARAHGRHVFLIEQGLDPKKAPGKSRFDISWQTYAPENVFAYLYYRIPGKPLFLALTQRGISKERAVVKENLIFAPNEESFHNFWLRTIVHNAPNESRETALALR